MLMKPWKPGTLPALVWTVVLAALATVFAAYMNPQLAFALATQAWACF